MFQFIKNFAHQDWSLGICYLAQGAILTLPDVALRIFLAETLHLSPSQVQLVYAFMLIPWLCKPFYGFISDTFPIQGYKRFPYLIISQSLTIIFWLILSLISFYDPNSEEETINKEEQEGNINYYLLLGLIGLYGESLFVCVSGVILDSIMVENVHEKELGKDELGQIQSFCTLWKISGTLFASIFSGVLSDHFEIYTVFFITALLPFITFFCILFFHEDRVVNNENLFIDNFNEDHNIIYLKFKKYFFSCLDKMKFIFSQLFFGPCLWKPSLFILLVSSTPSSYSAFYYYLYYDVKVTQTQFGIMMFITSIASFLGLFKLYLVLYFKLIFYFLKKELFYMLCGLGN